MSNEPPISESASSSAGIAGPLKRVLLCLGCVALMAGGTTLGILFERSRQTEPPTPAAAADESAVARRQFQPLVPPPEETGLSSSEESESSEEPADPALPVLVAEAAAASAAAPAAEPELVTLEDHLAHAEDLLAEGNYAPARDMLSHIVLEIRGLQEAEVRLRLGLCEEALGNLRPALAEYRRVVELKPRPVLRHLAILGQARVWTLSQRPELAIATLYRSMLENSPRVADAAQAQVPHQLALLMARRVAWAGSQLSAEARVLQDSVLQVPQLTVRPEQVIRDLQDLGSAGIEEEVTATVAEIRVVQRYSAAPEEIFLNVQVGRAAALEVLRRVTNESGWTVRLTETARMRLQEHSLEPNCLDLPLALILDSILEPFELIWRTSDQAILVSAADQAPAEEVLAYRAEAARRTLRYACAFAPDHAWAAACYLELGRVAAVAGELDEGVRHLSKAIELFPRSEFQPLAWFNLGKLRLLQGEPTESLTAFHRAADLLTGHPLEPVSYLYAGRIHLEADSPREAVLPLTRALVLAEGTSYQPLAAVLLSSCYLQLEHYQRANEVLMEHPGGYESSSVRDLAAFLSSVIRYRATTDERQRLREGATVVGALTNVNLESAFGGHWGCLIAQAYRDTGMTPEATAVLRKSLEFPYEFALKNRMRLMILDDAQMPQPLASEWKSSSDQVQSREILLQAGSAFRQGHTGETLRFCRQLVESPHVDPSSRREALRLMGRVYQSLGEHEQAVRCFAGLVPEEPAPASVSAEGAPQGDTK